MNCTIPNTPHRFKLAGMKVGDWFMGCPSCYSQYAVCSAGSTNCHCGGKMLIFDIKPHNAAEVEKHNRRCAS